MVFFIIINFFINSILDLIYLLMLELPVINEEYFDQLFIFYY